MKNEKPCVQGHPEEGGLKKFLRSRKGMKLKKWEVALILALVLTSLYGVLLIREQRQLSGKLIRLHVVANSDTAEDQALKLDVRDRVLDEVGVMLAGVTDRNEAIAVIESGIAEITCAAEDEVKSLGYDYSVRASIGVESFPTREYDTFSLPAGQYESLRVEIGEGDGKNWWCVVFPPLCAESAVDSKDALSVLSDSEISLITEDSAGYTVKFRALEWINKIFS